MTDPNYTHVSVLLDESGSMGRLAADTIGGFNHFLKEQKALPGKMSLSVAKFATSVSRLFKMQDVKAVSDLSAETYQPGGGTALLDAVGREINALGAELSALPEIHRPGKVLVLIITDGQENASVEFTRSQISAMIKHQEEAYKWNFLYLGANVDAFAEAGAIGVRGANAINYAPSSRGVAAAYSVVSETFGTVRSVAASNSLVEAFNSNHVDDFLKGNAESQGSEKTKTGDI